MGDGVAAREWNGRLRQHGLTQRNGETEQSLCSPVSPRDTRSGCSVAHPERPEAVILREPWRPKDLYLDPAPKPARRVVDTPAVQPDLVSHGGHGGRRELRRVVPLCPPCPLRVSMRDPVPDRHLVDVTTNFVRALDRTGQRKYP